MASQGVDPFAENEDQQALRELAREVAERELAPLARHWDESEEFPEASWDALKKAELFGITVDERYGGLGMGDIESPDATITQDYDTAAALSKNELTGTAAYMSGKLPVSGDLMKLMQLQGVLGQLPAALKDLDVDY